MTNPKIWLGLRVLILILSIPGLVALAVAAQLQDTSIYEDQMMELWEALATGALALTIIGTPIALYFAYRHDRRRRHSSPHTVTPHKSASALPFPQLYLAFDCFAAAFALPIAVLLATFLHIYGRNASYLKSREAALAGLEKFGTVVVFLVLVLHLALIVQGSLEVRKFNEAKARASGKPPGARKWRTGASLGMGGAGKGFEGVY